MWVPVNVDMNVAFNLRTHAHTHTLKIHRVFTAIRAVFRYNIINNQFNRLFKRNFIIKWVLDFFWIHEKNDHDTSNDIYYTKDILEKAQNKMDNIWVERNKKCMKNSRKNSVRIVCIVVLLDISCVHLLHIFLVFKIFPSQSKSVTDAQLILKQSSFGTIFCNMKNQVKK
jgi:hypothetical protein